MKWLFRSKNNAIKAPKRPLDLDKLSEKIVEGGNNAGEKIGGAINKHGKIAFIVGGTVALAVLFAVGLFVGSFFKNLFKK